jgi:hypothetical protein
MIHYAYPSSRWVRVNLQGWFIAPKGPLQFGHLGKVSLGISV